MATKEERTYERDLTYSRWQRQFGGYACDIDNWIQGYDHMPVALVETKHERVGSNYDTSSFPFLVNLGTKAGVPVFLVVYAADTSWFKVTPSNDLAREWLAETTTMSELQYVELLHRIRGIEIDPKIRANLKTTVPEPIRTTTTYDDLMKEMEKNG